MSGSQELNRLCFDLEAQVGDRICWDSLHLDSRFLFHFYFTGFSLYFSCLFVFLLFLGWDQSDKFVKIYVTLTGVHQVPPENVQVHFTERWVTRIWGQSSGLWHWLILCFMVVSEPFSFRSGLSAWLLWKGGRVRWTETGFPQELLIVHSSKINASWLCYRSFDLLVKNLNGKNHSMIVNNLLKPISVEGSSKKVSVLFALPYWKTLKLEQWTWSVLG